MNAYNLYFTIKVQVGMDFFWLQVKHFELRECSEPLAVRIVYRYAYVYHHYSFIHTKFFLKMEMNLIYWPGIIDYIFYPKGAIKPLGKVDC